MLFQLKGIIFIANHNVFLEWLIWVTKLVINIMNITNRHIYEKKKKVIVCEREIAPSLYEINSNMFIYKKKKSNCVWKRNHSYEINYNTWNVLWNSLKKNLIYSELYP